MGYAYQTADPGLYEILKEYSKKNRQYQTEAEHFLWESIRGENLGYRFKRQHIIGCFIADFVCLEKKLIIEVDGGYHYEAEQMLRDKYRTECLNKFGFDVIRFDNEEILDNIDNVLQQILNKLQNTN